jgi:hypothetical protein
MLQADHRSVDRLPDTPAAYARCLRAAGARGLLRGIKAETDLAGQGGRLVQSFRRLSLHLVEQDGQAQRRRFFSSA